MKEFHCFCRGLVLLAVCCGVSLALTSSKMEDGDYLKIVSVPSGNALTISGTDTTEGKPVILSSWSGASNQKFLAVEAVVAGDSFLLMPQRQRYPWQRFIRNGGTTPYKNRHDELPDWTTVMEGNTNTGAVTQDARDSKLYQQWRAVKVDSVNSGTKYLIKNRQNSQCLQAPGPAPTKTATTTTTTPAPPVSPTTRRSFFGNVWSGIRNAFGGSSSTTPSSTSTSTQSVSTSAPTTSSTNVILAACDVADERQHWKLEAIPYEY